MTHRMSFKHFLGAGLVLMAAAVCSTASATKADSSTVDDLSQAAEALGLQMLRPSLKIEPHRPYVMIVRDPSRLIRLGVDDVGRGDRVICRLLDGNRIVLYTSYGGRTAPIQLAPDGSIKSVQTVPVMKGNKHISAQFRDLHEGRGGRHTPKRTSGFGSRIR